MVESGRNACPKTEKSKRPADALSVRQQRKRLSGNTAAGFGWTADIRPVPYMRGQRGWLVARRRAVIAKEHVDSL